MRTENDVAPPEPRQAWHAIDAFISILDKNQVTRIDSPDRLVETILHRIERGAVFRAHRLIEQIISCNLRTVFVATCNRGPNVFHARDHFGALEKPIYTHFPGMIGIALTSWGAVHIQNHIEAILPSPIDHPV